MAQLQSVSFNEIKPGATVCILMEDPPLIYAVDIAMLVTGKNNNEAGKAVRTICKDPELSVKFTQRSIKLPSGTKHIKFVAYEDALELVMAIGGRRARLFRKRIANILLQHFENSMHKFIWWTIETAKQAEAEEAEREPETKYIYGAASEAFPGLVKIGYASSLDTRMIQANVFCAPAPFKIVAYAPSMDASRDERMAHAFFADHREEGEFFRVSVEAVENFFTNCILTMYNCEKNVVKNDFE